MLNIGVNATQKPAFINCAQGSLSCSRIQPTSTGGSASVGVNSTSTSSQNATTLRDSRWSSVRARMYSMLDVLKADSVSARLTGSNTLGSSKPVLAARVCQILMNRGATSGASQ